MTQLTHVQSRTQRENRDIERQEETSLSRTREERKPPRRRERRGSIPSLASTVLKVRSLGWREAINQAPQLFEEPFDEMPESERDYRRVFAVAMCYTLQTMEANGTLTSWAGYSKKLEDDWSNEPSRIILAIQEALKERGKSLSQSSSEKKKQEQLARDRVPAVPKFDPDQDSPETEPALWLERRMPELFERLLAVQESGEEDLFARQQRVIERATTSWESQPRVELAAVGIRKRLVGDLWPIIQDFELREPSKASPAGV